MAKEGILPNDLEEEVSITEDVEELLGYRENLLQYTFASGEHQRCLVIPAIFTADTYETVIPCGWMKKRWENAKSFVKKHRKAIIIGAIIVITVTAVTIAVIASSSSAASTIAGSAAGSAASGSNSGSDSSPEKPSKSFTKSSSPISSDSFFHSTMNEQVDIFKQEIAKESLFDTPSIDENLPIESRGKIMGLSWAHKTFDEFHNTVATSATLAREIEEMRNHIYLSPVLDNPSDPTEFGHREIDRRFSINYDYPYSYITADYNNKALPYQIQAEKSLDLGYYPEAIRSLNTAIEINPNDSTLYLERAASYFHMGQYDQSLEDFHTFTTRMEQKHQDYPLSLSEFSVGFARGLPRGVYESGEGIILFLSDFVSHPIHTSAQVVEAISTLVKLAHSNEWNTISKALAPEVCQLIQDWETIPSDKRGELAGYAIGKHGGDILIPGALAKVASKSIKSAKQLAAICKNIKLANESLILETAFGIGNNASLKEIMKSGKTAAFLREELGFTSKEIICLKESGQLESTIKNSVNHLNPSLQESLKRYQQAQKSLSTYIKKPLPENIIRNHIHATGIQTFPKPEGIPSNYIARITEKGAGMEYVHPNNPHVSIRVMPGKPHSPHPYQQKPYIVQMKNGKAIDKYGNPIDKRLPEAHIVLGEFIYTP